MDLKYKELEFSSIVFIYKLSGCGFKSLCSNLNFRYLACFKQGVPSHSGKYEVWIQWKICSLDDNNMQSNEP